MNRKLVIATRGSPLALCQTELVRQRIQQVWPEVEIEILKLSTTGDRQSQWSLEKKGGKGLFTKELEEALLGGQADLAVHSAKDLPTELPEGLTLAAFLPREDPRDVLVVREGVEVPVFIASSSPRRRAQAKLMMPNAVWSEIRGNVETRLKKIAAGEADGTIVAAAGLNRLGIKEWPGLRFKTIPIRCMVPAVGQGAIAVQCRTADKDQFQALSDEKTTLAVEIERQFLRALGGGCHVAFAAHYAEDKLHVFHENVGFFSHKFGKLALQNREEEMDKIVQQIRGAAQ